MPSTSPNPLRRTNTDRSASTSDVTPSRTSSVLRPAYIKTALASLSFYLNLPFTPYTELSSLLNQEPRMASASARIDIALSNYAAHVPCLSEPSLQLIRSYLTTLLTSQSATGKSELIVPLPYLLSTSIPRSFHVGTGLSATRRIVEAIENAEHEVLFVTCFWAQSESLEVLSDALRRLSDQKKNVRMRIGFSSRTLTQKLFHTSSPRGKNYGPATWKPVLGLPDPSELEGLDLKVKSIFYTPFSILHSKFVIIDRKLLFLPSSNISWEVWMEQATSFSGEIVDSFLEFWKSIWMDGTKELEPPPPAPASKDPTLPTLFLPHAHHRNPRFRPFSHLLSTILRRSPPPPPITPQTAFILEAINNATSSIFIQSPNFTASPMISALISALERGVTVDLVTGRRVMLLEQLVTTAGTAFTELCVWKLKRRARRRRAKGQLNIWYYTGPQKGSESEHDSTKACVKIHVKAMIVDGYITVLGSANADRASWWTSQEINAAVFDVTFAQRVRRGLVEGLGGRLDCEVGTDKLEEIAVGRTVEEV